MSLINDKHIQRIVSLLSEIRGGVNENKAAIEAVKLSIPDTSSFVTNSSLSSKLASYALKTDIPSGAKIDIVTGQSDKTWRRFLNNYIHSDSYTSNISMGLLVTIGDSYFGVGATSNGYLYFCSNIFN